MREREREREREERDREKQNCPKIKFFELPTYESSQGTSFVSAYQMSHADEGMINNSNKTLDKHKHSKY